MAAKKTSARRSATRKTTGKKTTGKQTTARRKATGKKTAARRKTRGSKKTTAQRKIGPRGPQGIPGAVGPQGPQGLPGANDDFVAQFGVHTNWAESGRGGECTLGEIILSAGAVANGVVANGQLLPISQNTALFSLLGFTYGGDGKSTFALPDLRAVAPNDLTYSICVQGIFPSRN